MTKEEVLGNAQGGQLLRLGMGCFGPLMAGVQGQRTVEAMIHRQMQALDQVAHGGQPGVCELIDAPGQVRVPVVHAVDPMQRQTAVAPAGAVGQAGGFQQHDFALGQALSHVIGCAHAGEAAADDGQVRGYFARERRVGPVIGRCGNPHRAVFINFQAFGEQARDERPATRGQARAGFQKTRRQRTQDFRHLLLAACLWRDIGVPAEDGAQFRRGGRLLQSADARCLLLAQLVGQIEHGF